MTPMTTLPVEAPWRDMTSAPKDGSMFLAYNAVHNEYSVVGWTEKCDAWTDVGGRNAGVTMAINPDYFQHWRPIPVFLSEPQPSPNELLEAAKEFAEAAAKEFNEKGAGGFALARLSDLRTAIRNAEQTTLSASGERG